MSHELDDEDRPPKSGDRLMFNVKVIGRATSNGARMVIPVGTGAEIIPGEGPTTAVGELDGVEFTVQIHHEWITKQLVTFLRDV